MEGNHKIDLGISGVCYMHIMLNIFKNDFFFSWKWILTYLLVCYKLDGLHDLRDDEEDEINPIQDISNVQKVNRSAQQLPSMRGERGKGVLVLQQQWTPHKIPQRGTGVVFASYT